MGGATGVAGEAALAMRGRSERSRQSGLFIAEVPLECCVKSDKSKRRLLVYLKRMDETLFEPRRGSKRTASETGVTSDKTFDRFSRQPLRWPKTVN